MVKFTMTHIRNRWTLNIFKHSFICQYVTYYTIKDINELADINSLILFANQESLHLFDRNQYTDKKPDGT